MNINELTNGVTIRSLEGKDIIRLQEGLIQELYSSKKAVFPASLTLEKLLSLELNVTEKKHYCKDIINVTFKYKLTEEKDGIDLEHLNIRKRLYKDGFNLDGIHYVYWFRSAGKAKEGQCLFINSLLYNKIIEWQSMDIKMPAVNAKIVEMSAYSALTSSHMEFKIKIPIESILVVNDLESFATEVCKVVDVNSLGNFIIEEKEYTEKNTLFDGQALIEASLLDGDYGYATLRQHFFKCASFKTNIQLFIKDYCKANKLDYDTYTIKDRYGNKIVAKNILLITTENAMKWEKFDITYDYWKEKIKDDNEYFAVVKTDKPSKYGEVQRMSYQHVNSLPATKEDVEELAINSIEYVNNIKNNENDYINFLKITANEMNANNMYIALYNNNPDFKNSKLFKDYKKQTISAYVKQLRQGKLRVKGDNLTVVGNPYLMLKYAISGNATLVDETLPIVENKAVTVYTKRFNNKEELCAFRNPHNSSNNIAYLINNKNKLMERYFKFSNNIVAVNLIGNLFQARLNGLDQDGDMFLASNNKVLIKCAKKALNYPTIINKVSKKNKRYNNTPEDFANMDNALVTNAIGLSSNMAQIAQSFFWDNVNKELSDICCILSVVAQIAIDSAKREFNVNIGTELERIKKLPCMSIKKDNLKAKPLFMAQIKKDINKNALVKCKCPMNYLQDILDSIDRTKNTKVIDTKDFIVKVAGEANRRQIANIEELITKYDANIKEMLLNEVDKDKKFKKICNEQDKIIKEISKIKMSAKTMNRIISKALDEKGVYSCSHLKNRILAVIYKVNPSSFIKNFK